MPSRYGNASGRGLLHVHAVGNAQRVRPGGGSLDQVRIYVDAGADHAKLPDEERELGAAATRHVQELDRRRPRLEAEEPSKPAMRAT